MIKLYKGDCLKVMKDIPDKSVDLVLIDPPYEQENHGGGKTNFAQRKLVKETHIDFISNGFDYEMCFETLLKKCKIPNLLIFCSNKQISRIMNYFESKQLATTLLVWEKTNPIPLGNGKYISDCEFIVYFRGKKAPFNNNCNIKNKYKVKIYPTITGKNRLHPTEKPIKLLDELIKLHSFENDTVLDCFMGSGTTGVACKRANRNFIGIELDDNYFEIAKKRIEEE